MSKEVNIKELVEKLNTLQVSINNIAEMLEKEVEGDLKFDDWITEEMAQKVSGLSRSTLLKLRKEGKLTTSTLSGKQNFYRMSGLQMLMDKNELT